MLTHSTSLNWLTRHFKGFGCPRIIISEDPNLCVDAYYDWYWGGVSEVDGQEVWNESGLIVLSAYTDLPEKTLILHEYRHHLQFQLYGRWPIPDWQEGDSLDDYNNCCFERDARLFEVSLGSIDGFTDGFQVPSVSRQIMLSLPTVGFLSSLPVDC